MIITGHRSQLQVTVIIIVYKQAKQGSSRPKLYYTKKLINSGLGMLTLLVVYLSTTLTCTCDLWNVTCIKRPVPLAESEHYSTLYSQDNLQQ